MKSLLSRLIILSLLGSSFSISAQNLRVKELVLPTEVKDIMKKGGSVFYSSGAKSTALIPTNIWGEVKNSGLHYIPQKTNLIKGLSLAGGTTGSADLDEVIVSRNNKGQWKNFEFDLTGGNNQALQFELQPGDVVQVKKDHFYENRTWYTSLLSVAATLISTALIYQQVKDD